MYTRTALLASLLVLLQGAAAQTKVGNVFIYEANSTQQFISLVQGFPTWNTPVVRENLKVFVNANVTLDNFEKAVPRSWNSIAHGDLYLESTGPQRVWIDTRMNTGGGCAYGCAMDHGDHGAHCGQASEANKGSRAQHAWAATKQELGEEDSSTDEEQGE